MGKEETKMNMNIIGKNNFTNGGLCMLIFCDSFLLLIYILKKRLQAKVKPKPITGKKYAAMNQI